MKDLNYVIGRLQGLNELVRILKDLVDKKEGGDPQIVSTITDHISAQLESILSEFDELPVQGSQKEALMEIKAKHTAPEDKLEEIEEVGDAPKKEEKSDGEKLDKHEKTVDDLLKDLESLKSQ